MKTIILTVVLSIATIAFAACGQNASNSNSAMNHGGMNHNSMNSNSMNMNGMGHNSQPMNSNMQMNHSGMKSDANAGSAPYDLQFIDTMISHHQGAVERRGADMSRSICRLMFFPTSINRRLRF